MLLRRFMQHIKDQNWFAVGLDIIVVIVGIFLGMQVQQWYEERTLANQEISYLEALQEDLKRLDAVFDRKIAFEDNRAMLSSHTYGLLEEEDFLKNKNNIVAGMIGLTDRRTASFTSPVYTDLLSSGKLILINNESLRKEIIAYFSELEFYQRVLEKNSKQFIDDSFHVFVYKHLKFHNFHEFIPPGLVQGNDTSTLERQKKLLQSNILNFKEQLPDITSDDPLWNEFKRELSWRALVSVIDGEFVAGIKENGISLSNKINDYLTSIQQ